MKIVVVSASSLGRWQLPQPHESSPVDCNVGLTGHYVRMSVHALTPIRLTSDNSRRLLHTTVLAARAPFIIGPGRAARITLVSLLPRLAPKLTSSHGRQEIWRHHDTRRFCRASAEHRIQALALKLHQVVVRTVGTPHSYLRRLMASLNSHLHKTKLRGLEGESVPHTASLCSASELSWAELRAFADTGVRPRKAGDNEPADTASRLCSVSS